MKISNREKKKLVKHIEKKINEYRHILNLNNWQIRLNQEITLDMRSTNTMQTTLSRAGYTNVHIDWGEGVVDMWRKKNWQALERLVLHELSHVLINDFSVNAHERYATEAELQYLEERLCDNISVIIHRLIK